MGKLPKGMAGKKIPPARIVDKNSYEYKMGYNAQGKGSRRRNFEEPDDFADNWDAIFGKKEDK
jgi:hypothetical protein